MTGVQLAILNTGLVTSVGLSAPSACAAIRARVANPTETRFIASSGEWIKAHTVPLERPWGGRKRLVVMGTLAIEECLSAIPREDWRHIPLLLCVAERQRPGRLEGLEDQLFNEIQDELGAEFSGSSMIIPHGRISVSIAMHRARDLVAAQGASYALIAATDSLLSWLTIGAYERADRLLTSTNSNGFMPGEGAGAILLGQSHEEGRVICAGIGFAMESAHINSEQPLRGAGLAQAVRDALADAECDTKSLGFRVTDLAGEHYYFKEAALAMSRVLRTPKTEFDMWHPAESIGETGAVAGAAAIAFVHAACRKNYAPGSNALVHSANDGGERAAALLRLC
jgi:3-oxoacyl-[acyl-carrier-protein] synthase-1